MLLKRILYKTLILSTVMATAVASQVSAQCIDAYMMDFDQYERGEQASKTRFRINELLVICFKTSSAGYVSIFDAPSKGDFEQLYPNAITHDETTTNVTVEANRLYCLGGSDTFPMYHPPEEGTGEGKISINLTRQQNAQLDPDAYAIPGQRVRRTTMELHLNNHTRSNNACTERDVKYIRYKVTN